MAGGEASLLGAAEMEVESAPANSSTDDLRNAGDFFMDDILPIVFEQAVGLTSER